MTFRQTVSLIIGLLMVPASLYGVQDASRKVHRRER